MTRFRTVPAAFAAAMAGAIALSAQQRAPEIDSIRQADMKADLYFLASDRMAGRLTDTPQNALAADWVASRFERLGLVPVGADNSYFHTFTLMTAALGTGNHLSVGAMPADWYPTRFSASASAKGELAFVGYGISSPERRYDDYAGGGVKGKIVIALDHEPGETDPDSLFDGVVTSQASNQMMKTMAAQAAGAVAILFVSDIHNHPQPPGTPPGLRGFWGAQQQAPRFPSYMLGAWLEKITIPAAQVSPALVEQLLARSKAGQTFEALAKQSDTRAGSKPVPLPGVEVEITTAVERKLIPDRNVVGLIEGADPQLRDEIVIVCAHYDHDGVNNGNVLNGADDDGSGTVGVMEIAEAYALAAQKGQRPKRSVLFAAWNSEERGLLGAWAYTEQPLRPLAKTVAVLNMDMIGRNEEVPESGGGRFRGLDVQTAESNANAVNIIGTIRSPSLKPVIERANRGIDLTLRLRYDNNVSQLMRRSDHWPFLNRGVPAVWVHTGLHPDYHTPNDDADRINYPKMEKITRMVYQASWDLANAELNFER
ncbi:MAG TPA: M28 family peptidase [Vicinamibacterales bacterium]|nr:M28 family peptidase [Vicinamibacterales bacterium]